MSQSQLTSDVKEECDGDHDNENEIDKEFDELCDTIKDDVNLQTEANVYEPFENDMNVDVID